MATTRQAESGIGRPPAAGEPRDVVIRLRVTKAERDALVKAAGGPGKLSEHIRSLIFEQE